MSKTNEKKLTSRERSAQSLAAAFGVANSRIATTTRDKTTNIGEFLPSGLITNRLTFDEAAELMRQDGFTETKDKDFDRMLARQKGVKLSNGVILRDVWSKGSSIPTKYEN